MDYEMHNTNGSVYTGMGTIPQVSNMVFTGNPAASAAASAALTPMSVHQPAVSASSATSSTNGKARKQEKHVYKQNKLAENCMEWAHKFCQAYMIYLNQENVDIFYKKDSKLTYMDIKKADGGITYTKGEYVGLEAIKTHLQIFRCLSNYQVFLFEVQPAGDKKSIEVYMRGNLTPSNGYPKSFTMALTLGKSTNQTIPLPEGELKTPQYIHNQFFTLE